MRILVAENDTLLRVVYEDFIAELGHSVASAFDGQEAIEMLRAEPFDLLLTDIQMPRLDAYALLALVKVELPRLVCIIVSGVDRERALPALAKTGARIISFCQKPFSFDHLARVLADAERGLAA